MFDYKSEGGVESIVMAAKEDGVTVQTGFDAAGQLQSCLDILKEFKGGTAKFVAAPTEEETTEFFRFVFGVWLKAKREFVPSAKIKVVEGGLESANKALDQLKNGVSGMKLVLEV